MKKCLSSLALLSLCSCSSSGELKDPTEPFEIREPAVSHDLGLPEVQDTPVLIEPLAIGEHHVDYAPGQLLWADQEYKVRFHFKSEISSYEETHLGWPDHATLRWESDMFFRETEELYHAITFPGWYYAYYIGAQMVPQEPSKADLDRRDEWTSSYAGVYLPEYMREDGEERILHMFECFGAAFGSERYVYKLQDMYFTCGIGGYPFLHIPEHSKYVSKFKCNAHHLAKEIERLENKEFPFYDEECMDSDPSSLTKKIRVAAWIGDTSPLEITQENGFSYDLFVSGNPGRRHTMEHCPIDLAPYDESLCEEEKKNWRAILVYEDTDGEPRPRR